MRCPLDGRGLVELEEETVATTVCTACRRAFRFADGDVRAWGRTEHDEAVEVRLELGVGEEALSVKEEVAFGRLDVDYAVGARLRVCQQKDRRGRWRLVWLEDASGARRSVRDAGDQAAVRTFGLAIRGSIAVTFATILAVYFSHWWWALATPVALGLVALAALLTYKRRTTRVRLEPEKRDALEHEQELLAELE